MLDIAIIRDNPQWVKQKIKDLNATAPIDEILKLDTRKRALTREVDNLRRKRNVRSKEIGKFMGRLRKLQRGDANSQLDEITQLQRTVEDTKAATRHIGEQIASLEAQLKEVDRQLYQHMLWVPNLPHDSVPVASDESHNIVSESQGPALPQFDFTPKPHWDIGPALDIIDFERGVKLSGTRFYLLKGLGARLQRAVIQFMLDLHVNEHGYREIYPPCMVRREMFVGAAQLPKFEDNIYRDTEEDFMWLGTAEIALTNIHRDEILKEEALPLKYVAYTPCFRREKMSAGRDVRGIKRGHQFDKVEMYIFSHPEQSYDLLDMLVAHAADVCEKLGLTYRTVEMVTGDLGFAAAKKYDIEVWAAGCEEWLEVSSASNCETFQARRANVRFRPSAGGKPRFVHTLNASGLALPRVMIAIMENNQDAQGNITIPPVLRPYMGGVERITV